MFLLFDYATIHMLVGSVGCDCISPSRTDIMKEICTNSSSLPLPMTVWPHTSIFPFAGKFAIDGKLLINAETSDCVSQEKFGIFALSRNGKKLELNIFDSSHSDHMK